MFLLQACHLLSDTEMVCPSPRLPISYSTPTKRRQRRQVEEVLLAVSLDDYLVNISESFEFYPDPRYDTFQEPNGVKQVSSNDTLRITVSV